MEENKQGHAKIEWIPGEKIAYEGLITNEEIEYVILNTTSKQRMMLDEMGKLANASGRISDRLMMISEFYKLKEDLEKIKKVVKY